MTFAIDTGEKRPLIERLPSWFLDGYPDAEAMTDARLAHDFGQWMIGEALRPKKAETCRKHILGSWWVLPIIADHHPEVFDEILTTYALRVEGVEV
jgi:hypothetical protein